MSLHTLPHKKEYVLYLDSSMRQTCCVECPLDIPELENDGIKVELDALGLMREMSPKEYDALTEENIKNQINAASGAVELNTNYLNTLNHVYLNFKTIKLSLKQTIWRKK